MLVSQTNSNLEETHFEDYSEDFFFPHLLFSITISVFKCVNQRSE